VSARENILGRIRTSLRREAGDGAAARVHARLAAHALSPRPQVAGDLVAYFREKALALSTTVADVADLAAVPAAVAAYLSSNALPMHAVCSQALGGLDWAGHGVSVEALPARETDKVGITEVFCAIAETGTLMTLSSAHTPPVSSLLPETHIAIVRVAQIVSSMEEAWQRLRDVVDYPPRAVNFISGPSRTADIEQTLTFGAHGPYRVHVVLVRD
jgi:L-lactate dehydrogenase complex protein LldG